jgi:energy-coupling factor transporter ATP-binding protein EcfA2
MKKSPKAVASARPWDFKNIDPVAAKFKAVIINHPKMKSTMNAVTTALASKTDPGVLLLVGSTGVGKSTLVDSLQRELLKSVPVNGDGLSAYKPIVWTRATPPQNGKFDWRDYISRALKQAGDVLMNRKVVSPETLPLFDDLPGQIALDGNGVNAMRRGLESCLRHRHTRYLVIDEAQYLLFIHDNLLTQQLETLKSLAEEAGVVIILVGTYRLLEVQNQSAQLVRRSQVIAFSRYRDDVEAEVREFANAVSTLYTHIPIKKNLDFAKHIRFIYKQSCGCVGVLKDWFTATLIAGIRENKPFDLALLQSTARANQDILTLHKEAMEGEAQFSDMTDEEFDDALAAMKHNFVRVGGAACADAPAETRGKPKRGRVGKRLPKRDPVGDQHARV